MRPFKLCRPAWLLAAMLALTPMMASASGKSFIGPLTVTPGPFTVPANGDVNPYGVAVVPRSTGKLIKGHVLVSNFNALSNLQGTGTTIVDVDPNGTVTVFATISEAGLPGPCPGGIGLTTALSVLRSGWVIVGSLPTSDGTSTTAQAGCLLVLNQWGKVVETLSGWRGGVQINGPWDMTALDLGSVAELFVTNVLNGTVTAGADPSVPGPVVNKGTVVRILLFIPEYGNPREILRTVVGSGFPERTDPGALVVGPTGVALDDEGSLYVADTQNNRIAKISHALTRFRSGGIGKTISVGGALNQPLGVVVAPNEHVLAVNAGDGNIVEIAPWGAQVAVKDIDTSHAGGGTLFGLAITPDHRGVYFVDDGDNTLDLLH
jgi:NHL repeat